MKHTKKNLLPVAVLLLLCAGCGASQVDIPTGCWQSMQGRPSLTLEKDSAGAYHAIVYHRTADGRTCPVTYPVVRNANGMYIQAEGRILICYSFEEKTLFLSPGGLFQLKNNTLNGIK